MTKQILRGDELQIWLDGLSNSVPAYCPMYATSHTVTITGNTVDIATKDHGFWGASTVGTITWEVTAECLLTTADYDMLFDAMVSKTRLKAYFAPVRNYSPNGLQRVGGDVTDWLPAAQGKQGYVCVTSLTVNANTGENSTYSITFTGQGALTKYDLSNAPYKINVRYKELINPETEEGVELFNMRAKNSIVAARAFAEGQQIGTLLDLGDSNVYPLDSEPENGYIEFTVYGPSVPEYMFYRVEGVRNVYMPYHIITIEEFAFANTGINTIEYECESMNIMHDSFSGCSYLDNINQSHDINYLQSRQIGGSAFASCVRLTNVNVGDACKNVGIYAFSENHLNSVYFSDEIRTIGEGAFSRGGMQTTLKAYFSSENAPNLNGSNALGSPAMLEVHLLNAVSADDWTRNFTINGWSDYEPADGTAYIIGS